MRCPDCSKFVAYDTEAEPEATLDVDFEGMLTGEVERPLNCAECGTTLKSTSFSVDQDLNDIVDVKLQVVQGEACTKAHDWDWDYADEPTVSTTERLNDKDKNGKQIKYARFMTKYYGIEIVGEVRCKDCPAVGSYELKDEASASSFDEQV